MELPKSSLLRTARAAGPTLLTLVALAFGCSPSANPPDGGPDGDVVVVVDVAPDVPSDARICETNAECDDGVYCNGEERCTGRVCMPAASPPCNDGASCTQDSCDETMRACTHMADHSMCGDGDACNGIERCDPTGANVDRATGCERVRPDHAVDCDDGNTCTLDGCDVGYGCIHSPRDLDGDGHVDRACALDGTPGGPHGDDCNDSNPTAFPGASEDCDDGVDNDCNGTTDYFDAAAACSPRNDACSGARALPGPGTYSGSTAGLTDNQVLSCNTARNVPDAVFAITLTEPADVLLSLVGAPVGSALALMNTCDPYAERSCSRTISAPGGGTVSPSVFVRSLPAGTHLIVVETSASAPFRLSYRTFAPTVPPPGDSCPPLAATFDLVGGTPSMATLASLTDDFSLTCNPGLPTRDVVFHLNLPVARNVDLRASADSGTTFMSVRGAPCESGSQLRCVQGQSPASANTSLRNLPAGDYYIMVEHSAELPVTVTATLSDPGVVATGDACRAPATIALTGAFPQSGAATIDPTGLLGGADHGTSCGSGANPDGWRDGVATYTLGAPSDVTVTVNATGAGSPSYAWSVESMCGQQSTEVAGCRTGAGTTPMIRRYFAQPAGTYSVVLESTATPAPGYQVAVELCPAGQTVCGGACVDTLTDVTNCGTCGTACAGGQTCVRGGCAAACAPGTVTCGTSCTNLSADSSNCGTCGRTCGMTEICSGGSCTTACPTGLSPCGGACVNRDVDAANCGTCGVVCAVGQTCVAGGCTTATMSCVAPAVNCGTACVDVTTDPTNCGACGRPCGAGRACIGGTCTVTCNAGETRCGPAGSCANLQRDSANCGTCGFRCASGMSCFAGTCVPDPSFRLTTLSTTGCTTSTGLDSTAGDQRGTLVATSAQVFYTGDNSTVRMSSADLTGVASLGVVHNTLVSDLRGDLAYIMLDASGTEPSFSSSAVTQFAELDSSTGAVTARRVMLSRPIVLNTDSGGSGIFSGYGRVILFISSGVDTGWWQVSMPSGVVTRLTGSAAPSGMQGCESWAASGVAEFVAGEPYAVFWANSVGLVRQRISDGVSTTITAVSSTGDACTVGFSPTRNRWYFQFEAPPDFVGSFGEFVATCPGTFDTP